MLPNGKMPLGYITVEKIDKKNRLLMGGGFFYLLGCKGIIALHTCLSWTGYHRCY